MDPNNRKQEHLVGIYRNTVQPLTWMEDVTEAAKELGPKVVLLSSDKVRVHLLSMGELDNAHVSNFDDAEKVAENVSESIHRSFYYEKTVALNGLALFRIGNSGKRAIILPLIPDDDIEKERSTAIDGIPWTEPWHKPVIGHYRYRLRIGTVLNPEIANKVVTNTLKQAVPDSVRLQQGKIKTLK
jgi:hypothetical protein